MSYVDAYYNKDRDVIQVAERNTAGDRVYKEYPGRHLFYYPDPKGKFCSMKGEPLSRITSKNIKEHRKELALNSHKKIFESDIKPVYRCLEDNYLHIEPPKLNVAFWDIEVDMQPFAVSSQKIVKVRKKDTPLDEKDITVFRLASQHTVPGYEVWDDIKKKWVDTHGCRYLEPGPGYASPDDAFMPITAIAVHLQWLDTLVCLAIPPKSISIEEATALIADIPNTILFTSEAKMLDMFLNLIEDADVLSGWNSEGFDMPYTVNRIIKTLSRNDTKRLCLWDQTPRKKEYEKFGKTATTYEISGRVHLDSLELYRKYTYEERHSYRLDAIGELEVNESKIAYEGTLDQLYNNDFKKFIEYNRQDTALLDKLDKKLKFIDLANSIAHENGVLLPTTMGAVAVTEQAIIIEAHRRGCIVPNRLPRDENANTQAAGAYVAFPSKGIHEWVGSLDVNSLYPSAIRALNMGPETIVGQLRQTNTNAFIAEQLSKGKTFATAWEGIFGSLEYTAVMNKEVNQEITIDWEKGGEDILSAAQVYTLIFDSNQPWILSANGTIFTYEIEGVIPGLLKRWYEERQQLQTELKNTIDLKLGVSISNDLASQLTIT